MAKLVYGMLQSLDGYTEDEHGDFNWARPDAEVHAFVNRLDASIGTDIYGRRLYETMKFWQTVEDDGSVEGAWAVQWQAKQKIVVSATLPAVETPRTTLLRTLDAAALVSLKAESSADLSIGARPSQPKRFAQDSSMSSTS